MNEREKMDAVKRKAEWMEEQAKMQEQLIRVAMASGQAEDQVQKTIQVNDMYVEAIHAKLKILDSI